MVQWLSCQCTGASYTSRELVFMKIRQQNFGGGQNATWSGFQITGHRPSAGLIRSSNFPLKLLLAQSLITNSVYMDTWLAFHRMVLPTRVSLFEITLGGRGLWGDLGSRDFGRSIKPVMKSLREVEYLSALAPQCCCYCYHSFF